MRDLKFRGVNAENGWIYGMYVDGFIVDDVIEATDEYINLGRWCPVDTDSVGQYTGLKDKNGTEIYEGDIIKGVDKRDPLTGVVKWFNKNASFNLLGINTENFKVIGNVYENPELLDY